MDENLSEHGIIFVVKNCNYSFVQVASIAALAATAANAEPWWGYGGYGLGWWGKSAPCVNAANIPVPCAGKRKREAEVSSLVLA